MTRSIIVIVSFAMWIAFLMYKASERYEIQQNLKFIIKHPLNKDRPATTLLGTPLSVLQEYFTLQPVLNNIDTFHLNQLLQVYQVTDGLKASELDGVPIKDLWLLPGYYMMSLEEVVDTCAVLRRTSDVWNLAWLPIFSSRSGDFIVYDTNNGHVYEMLTKESLEWEVAPSLQHFLGNLAQKFSTGRIHIDEHGLMTEKANANNAQNNDDREDEISNTLLFPGDSMNHVRAEILQNEENVEVPNLIFACTNMPNICQNIKNAINSGKTRNLQRITDPDQIKKNRQNACGHVSCKKGDSCDEYPFASTSQGGTGATTMCVPLSENNSQGGQLARFYRLNKVGDKDFFYMQSP
ncbi:hypothetical protein CHS0354_030202 [Potamilus streckersoni]|uniref:Deoxyribonuclease NucA/NucB domain-containing protein n=1 Tax=Potamilus streckersoni TaxID=2493646 RepID=A0AAE0RSG3_9BIVA|nr:hypothetical protein CHS0354_030202 [Potamilus streckersoni]